MEFWLRLSGWVFVVLALLTAVVLGMGSRLPEHEVRTAAGVVQARPAKVWAVLEDVEAEPAWRSDVRSVAPLPERAGLPCWRERGRLLILPLCVTSAEVPERRTVAVVDPKFPLQGTWTVELRAEGTETRVEMIDDLRVEPSLWRFARRYLRGEGAGPAERLADLQRLIGGQRR